MAVNDGLDPLEIGDETALGGGGDVHADAAFLLGFAAAPYMAALDRPGSG